MSACVFIGPTLSVDDARTVLDDARYLWPVQQGDVYRAAIRHRPRAIGIVDGAFQHAPSVWHKEILWVMAHGIHVFGSASMGALRGAELAAFGMRGVGRIFEAYRDARLAPYDAEPFEDDDEVAVVHGPPETGFAALSESMVNIRCTLAAAADAGVITLATRDALVKLGKARFYPERSYQQLLHDAAAAGLSPSELAALRAWLSTGRINQKRTDALAMLRAMRECLAGGPSPLRVAYVFEPSEMWGRLAGGGDSVPGARPDATADGDEDRLLDELRLDGTAWVEARRRGLLRMAALRESERQRVDPGDDARRQAADALRWRLGVFGREAVDRWIRDNDLDRVSVERLLDDEARLGELGRRAGGVVEAYLLDELRATGEYARYAARARAKQRAEAAAGLETTALDEWTKLRLTAWYFEHHRGGAVPDDLPFHAARLGFRDLDAFYRALLREYVYLGGEAPRPDGGGAPPDVGAERHAEA